MTFEEAIQVEAGRVLCGRQVKKYAVVQSAQGFELTGMTSAAIDQAWNALAKRMNEYQLRKAMKQAERRIISPHE